MNPSNKEGAPPPSSSSAGGGDGVSSGLVLPTEEPNNLSGGHHALLPLPGHHHHSQSEDTHRLGEKLKYDLYSLATRQKWNEEAEVALARKEHFVEAITAANTYTATGKKFVRDCDTFLNKLANCSSKTANSEGSSAAVNKIVSLLRESNQMQSVLLDQLQALLISPMDRIVRVDMRSLADMQRKFDEARDQYDQAKRKNDLSQNKRASYDSRDQDKQKKMEQEYQTAARNYELWGYGYAQKLSDLQTKNETLLTEQICALYQAHYTYYKHGVAAFSESQQFIDEVHVQVRSKKQSLPTLPDLPGGGEGGQNTHHHSESVPPTQTDPNVKQGYLIKKGKMRVHTKWVVVNSTSVQWFQNWKDSHPQGSVPLMLCTLRNDPDKASAFRVISPDKTVTFQAASVEEKDEWFKFIGNRITAQLQGPTEGEESADSAMFSQASPRGQPGYSFNTKKAYHDIRAASPSNHICADCARKDPEWASLTTGTIICIECSGVHRSLGVQVSKIRSLVLDRWDEATLDYMKELGNERANAIWEARVSDFHVGKPNESADRQAKEMFITAKYVARLWVEPPPPGKTADDLHLMLWEAASKNNIPECLKLCLQGADAAWNNPAAGLNGSCLLHHLVTAPVVSLSTIDFLLHRSKIDVPDASGQTPLHLIVMRNHLELARLFIARGARPTLKDKNDVSALELALQHNLNSMYEILSTAVEQKRAAISASAPAPSSTDRVSAANTGGPLSSSAALSNTNPSSSSAAANPNAAVSTPSTGSPASTSNKSRAASLRYMFAKSLPNWPKKSSTSSELTGSAADVAAAAAAANADGNSGGGSGGKDNSIARRPSDRSMGTAVSFAPGSSTSPPLPNSTPIQSRSTDDLPVSTPAPSSGPPVPSASTPMHNPEKPPKEKRHHKHHSRAHSVTGADTVISHAPPPPPLPLSARPASNTGVLPPGDTRYALPQPSSSGNVSPPQLSPGSAPSAPLNISSPFKVRSLTHSSGSPSGSGGRPVHTPSGLSNNTATLSNVPSPSSTVSPPNERATVTPSLSPRRSATGIPILTSTSNSTSSAPSPVGSPHATGGKISSKPAKK